MIYGHHDQGTLSQWQNVTKRPDVLEHALMPDAHFGYTMPIGGVALTASTVYPSWVGYDIGCGVCAVKVKNELPLWNLDGQEAIRKVIYDRVPRDQHKRPIARVPDTLLLSQPAKCIVNERSAYKQLGTLGGGNHFIELDMDELGNFWIVIHSGSRGVGHGIAGHWMDIAKGTGDTGGMDPLAYGTKEFHHYMTDMTWCIDYALENRRVMLREIEEALHITLDWDTLINKVHNMASVNRHGEVLHRKGATSAGQGELGVIPGNMRDGSVIVEGLGNPLSLSSCSHGAGRAYARGKAKRELSLETFTNDMVGIACHVDEKCLDECPAAYKNFDEVMDLQKELCTVVHRLRPIVNVKG